MIRAKPFWSLWLTCASCAQVHYLALQRDGRRPGRPPGRPLRPPAPRDRGPRRHGDRRHLRRAPGDLGQADRHLPVLRPGQARPRPRHARGRDALEAPGDHPGGRHRLSRQGARHAGQHQGAREGRGQDQGKDGEARPQERVRGKQARGRGQGAEELRGAVPRGQPAPAREPKQGEEQGHPPREHRRELWLAPHLVERHRHSRRGKVRHSLDRPSARLPAS